MMKGEIEIERISDQMIIIDAYIIDELAKQNNELLNEGEPAQLPCPRYDMDINEVNAEDDKEETVIIIEL